VAAERQAALAKKLAKLSDERQKLLSAFYANAIPLELLKDEQDRSSNKALKVVDIGCGTGLTTREAARAAAPGRVVVDVSERMLERACQVTAAERLDNVRYELGDAQVHPFDAAGFDVAISRFGTMFFSDPAAAFANIAAALRPEARLVLLVWQRQEHNEWARAIDAALGDAAQPPQPGADPFSLGDAEATAGILEGAGFDEMRFEDVHEPVLYGHDLDGAFAFVRGFQDTSAALASLSDREAARTVERLREMLAAHYSDERGVVLDSRFLVDHGPATPVRR